MKFSLGEEVEKALAERIAEVRVQWEAELAAAHAQLAEWREAVVAANRISQAFEARARKAEARLADLLGGLGVEGYQPAGEDGPILPPPRKP